MSDTPRVLFCDDESLAHYNDLVDCASQLKTHFERELAAAQATIAALRTDAEQMERRYIWSVNALIASDYGDNDSESLTGRRQVGWRVYGWRTRNGELIIYGTSIREAIDQYLAEHPEITESIDAAIAAKLLKEPTK